MSLKIKAIGIGAAGNKAVMQLIKDRVVPVTDTLLINSTTRDIPEGIDQNSIVLIGNTGGCGKDRDLAKQMMIDYLQSVEENPIDALIDGDEKMILLCSSTEGGTGSGASVILSKYIQAITKSEETPNGIPVNMVSFTGFEDDARGLKNTVEWFKDLDESVMVQSISNKSCLPMVDNNRRAAEEYANKVFSQRVRILIGKDLNPSDSNVDNMDLYKLNTAPGYMTVEYIDLEKISEPEQFNDSIQTMIDKSVSLPTEPSAKRLGVIVSASNRIQGLIDEGYDQLIKKYGFPTEIFRHKQDGEGVDSVAVIASGMKLPIDEIKEVYHKFERAMQKTDLAKDNFFNMVSNMDTNLGFGTGPIGTNQGKDKAKIKKNKQDFFSAFSSSKKVITVGDSKVRDEL